MRRDEHWVELEVNDDGIGLPATFSAEGRKSLGLQVVAILTRQIGGTIEINGEGGARFKIRWRFARRESTRA